MFDHPELRYLTDAKGNVEAVQLSLKLWQLIEPKITAQLKASEAPAPLVQAEGPLKSFEQLQQTAPIVAQKPLTGVQTPRSPLF